LTFDRQTRFVSAPDSVTPLTLIAPGHAVGRLRCRQNLHLDAIPRRPLSFGQLYFDRGDRLQEQSSNGGPDQGEVANMGHSGTGALPERDPRVLQGRSRALVALRRDQQDQLRQYKSLAERNPGVRPGRRRDNVVR
jgi:hypothetical protein